MARGGWLRLGRKHFRYVDSRGHTIRDDENLERIAALAIPPAWTDVWISPNPRARLQATGVDSAGRKQYLYHQSYRAAQEREKYERLLEFAKDLPVLRARMSRHLRLDPYEREWTCAIATQVINKAWFRVGSEGMRAARTRTSASRELCRDLLVRGVGVRVEVGPGEADLAHIPAEHRYRGRPGRLLNLETIGATAGG